MSIDTTLVQHKLDFLDKQLTKIEQMAFDQSLAERMGKAADFRNRVVHGYNDFDYSLLFRDYKENIEDLRNFGAQILKFLGR